MRFRYASRTSGRKGIVEPPLGRIHVKIGGDDVEVASKHYRPVPREQFGGMRREPLKPAKLVVELRTGRGIAVGQVEATDDGIIDQCLDVAAVGVLGVLGKRAPDLDRLGTSGENCDTVPALLPMPDRAAAGTADCVNREPLLGCFELLKADDVRRGLSEPVEEHTSRALIPFTL
jgi:hypothetical protein